MGGGERGRNLLKIGDGDMWPHWPPFFQHALTHWLLYSTRSHPMTPFLIICNQFSTISHQITPLFDKISSKIFQFKIEFFGSKMCPNMYFAWKIGHNLSAQDTYQHGSKPSNYQCTLKSANLKIGYFLRNTICIVTKQKLVKFWIFDIIWQNKDGTSFLFIRNDIFLLSRGEIN